MISWTGSGVLCFFGGKVVNMDIGASVRSNVIINRDCLAALKDMPDKSVDSATLAAPPPRAAPNSMIISFLRTQMSVRLQRLLELVLQHYILLSKRIPISDLTLPCGWQTN